MFSRLRSASTLGINAFIIEIETHLDNAVPAFNVVGLPGSAVKESRDRVTAAIKNSHCLFPNKKVTVNLAPADIRKDGSELDLPIALGILSATGQISEGIPPTVLLLGELALDGAVRPIHGALAVALEARNQGFERILLPRENAEEAAMIPEIGVIPVDSLRETIDYLNGEHKLTSHSVDIEAIFNRQTSTSPDLQDVKGQENVKRALEVAAAGGHNIVMIGPPGSGKSMLAKRLPGILPPMTLDEAMETTKIHSVAGLMAKGQALVVERPFRSPHHTISDAALVGGGVGIVKAGEISLAHHGVLFMDELPEFARNVLEVLRQPLEDKKITIARTKMTVEYPANFMMVCSMNPCPCGNFGNPAQECTCSPQQIQRYMAKISGPLLDRIDIHVDVPVVKYQDLTRTQTSENSLVVRNRVYEARRKQMDRFSERSGIHKNADMEPTDIREYCPIDRSCQELMKMAMTKLGLSARAFDRILKVSRTIADLEDRSDIRAEHISEAIQYRSLDRQYWNA